MKVKPSNKSGRVIVELNQQDVALLAPPASGAETLRLKKLLVPIDFSPSSIKALHYAVSLAGQFGASIHLLHVVESAATLSALSAMKLAVSDEEMAQRARDQLRLLAEREIGDAAPVHAEVRVGKPFQEIVALAKKQGIDCVVIATHGYTGLKHAVMGSTTERVVRHSSCPVLVVREHQRDFIAA
jgi:nucleotide-binding universal stress UspA family protein